MGAIKRGSAMLKFPGRNIIVFVYAVMAVMFLSIGCVSSKKSTVEEVPVVGVAQLDHEYKDDEKFQAASDAIAAKLGPHHALAWGASKLFAQKHKLKILRDLNMMKIVSFHRSVEKLAAHVDGPTFTWTGDTCVARTPLPGNTIHIVLQDTDDKNLFLFYWECARYLYTPDDYDALPDEKKRVYDKISEEFADACMRAKRL